MKEGGVGLIEKERERGKEGKGELDRGNRGEYGGKRERVKEISELTQP